MCPGAFSCIRRSSRAIALFVVNDHVFKPAHPGWLTGKLSDVAGLIFFPVLLAAVAELVIPVARRHVGATLLLAVAVTGLTYVAMLVIPAGGDGYRWFIGIVQWPFRIAGGARGRDAAARDRPRPVRRRPDGPDHAPGAARATRPGDPGSRPPPGLNVFRDHPVGTS